MEAWLFGMDKYFRIHDYSRNEKAIILIYNLNGRASIRWEHLMQVNVVKERRISLERFERYFKEKYLSSRYYDNKRKDFNVLNLGRKIYGRTCPQALGIVEVCGLHQR